MKAKNYWCNIPIVLQAPTSMIKHQPPLTTLYTKCSYDRADLPAPISLLTFYHISPLNSIAFALKKAH